MILRTAVLSCLALATVQAQEGPPITLVNFPPFYTVTALTNTFPITPVGSCSTLTLKATTNPVMAPFSVQAQITGPSTIQPVPPQTMSFSSNPANFLFNLFFCPTNGPALNTQLPLIFTETGSGGSNPHPFNLIGNAVLPTVQETVPSVAGVGDPVSAATLELFQQLRPDLYLGGPMDLQFSRYYASYLNVNGVTSSLGNNWISNLHAVLTVSGSGPAVTIARGKVVRFQQPSSGNVWPLAAPDLYGYQLIKDTDGTYRFLNPEDRRIYTFSSSGALQKIADRNGNALTNTIGQGVSDVTDGLGRSLHLTYTANKIVKVSDQTGRSVGFSYTGDDPTSFTDAAGNVTTYSYTTAGPILSLMTSSTLPAGNKPYTQTFNNLGFVTRQTDSFNNATTLAFDPLSSTTTITNPLASVTQDVHASFNKLMKETDANSQNTTYTYDSAGRRTSVTDRLGNKTAVTYHDPSGYLASVTDALGGVTMFTYTAQTQAGFTFYNLTKISYPDGTSESFAYDNFGNVLTGADRAGKVSSYTYNSRGQVLTATNPAGGVTTLVYNADATLASLKSPAGDMTSFSYDDKKRLLQIKYADSASRTFSFDNLDNLLTATDERGKIVKAAYDPNSNLKSATDPLNQSTQIGYDTDDLVTSVTDPLGKTTRYEYDPLGSVTAVTNPAGEKTSYAYDALNRLKSIADPAGKGPTFTYDAEGRPVTVTDALANTTRYDFDKLGRTARITTPLGENTDVTFDALGRVTSATNPLSQKTTYGYDARGLLTGIALPGGISASYARADLGSVTSITDPNGNAWTRAYDNLGRITSRTDPLGRGVTYAYDARNRLSAVTSPEGTLAFTYDSAGNRIRSKYSDGTDLSFTFDDNNRVTAATGVSIGYDAAGRVTQSNGLTIARDAAGRIASIVYPPGAVTYAYDVRGLLASVTDWAGGGVTLTYNDAGDLISLTRSNGVTTQFTYDKNRRLSGITETGGGNTLLSIGLQRDAAGKVVSADRNLPQSPDVAPGTLQLAFDAAHQLSGASYDGVGKLTNDGLRTYTWDLASRLSSYTGADGAASFTYDALQQRISRTASDGTVANYVVNYATALPSVAVVQSNGADLRYYVYLPDGSLLYSIEAADGARRYYSFDETGSTTMLTGDDGAITDAYGVTPYGETVTHFGATDNPFTFQGRWGVMQESGTSLYYMRFRYYDSAMARFLSRDPVRSLDARAINPYQYVEANPLSYADPTGLKGVNISLSQNTVYFGPTPPVLIPGQEVEIDVPPGTPWTTAVTFNGKPVSNATVTPSSGVGPATVVIQVPPNTSVDARGARVTFISGSSSAFTFVFQAGARPPCTDATLDDKSASIGPSGGTAPFTPFIPVNINGCAPNTALFNPAVVFIPQIAPSATFQQRFLQDPIGGALNLGNSGLFLDAGFLGDTIRGKNLSPSDASHAGGYIGLGIKFWAH